MNNTNGINDFLIPDLWKIVSKYNTFNFKLHKTVELPRVDRCIITPDNNIWKHVSLIFIATQNSSHISVRTKIGTAGWTQVDNFTISPMASVGEHEYKSNLIVYPNPANTYVNIDLQETISSGSASIINLSGQVLTTSEINYTENIHLDLRTIPSGVYFIRIESELFSDFVKFIKK